MPPFLVSSRCPAANGHTGVRWVRIGIIGAGALGSVIGGIFWMPISSFFNIKKDINLNSLIYLEMINGFLTSVLGAILFRLFGLTPGFLVPIIMAAWITFSFFIHHQPLKYWIGWLVGMFIGWFTLARILVP